FITRVVPANVAIAPAPGSPTTRASSSSEIGASTILNMNASAHGWDDGNFVLVAKRRRGLDVLLVHGDTNARGAAAELGMAPGKQREQVAHRSRRRELDRFLAHADALAHDAEIENPHPQLSASTCAGSRARLHGRAPEPPASRAPDRKP